MSQIHRRSTDEVDHLERLVRSLEERLTESKGETKGAVMAVSQISQRASDLDARLLTQAQSLTHAVRDVRLLRRTVAELVVDLGKDGEGRDPAATLALVVELLTGQGIVLTADIQAVRVARSWRGAVRGDAPDVSTSPVMASIQAAEDRIRAEAKVEHAHASAVQSASSAAAAAGV